MDSYKITIEAFDKMASAYQAKFMHLDLYNDSYDIFCELIPKSNPKVLEIGCGPGNITKYLLTKRPDFKIKAIDLAPNMVKLAQENNPNANCKVMDVREIDKLTEKYSGLIAGFCLPYLSKTDCAKMIKDSYNLLYNGGILYISTIEGNYLDSGFQTSSNGQDKAYVYYHQEDYLQAGLKENNFKLLNLIRKHYINHHNTPSTHLIFIAEKI